MAENHRIKILRVIARLNVGGPARHVISLSARPPGNGWETKLVAGSVGKGEASMEGFARDQGLDVVIIPELGRRIQPFQDIAAFWKLLSILRKMQPDILHTHTAKAGAVGRLAGWAYRRLHMRGLWAPRPLQVYHTFHGHVLRGYFSPVAETFFRFVERFLATLASRIITLSPSLKRELVELGVALESKVTVVPLGLKLAAFQAVPDRAPVDSPFRRELNLPRGAKLVGIVGRLVPIKDHETFLQAARLLVQAEARDGPFHFAVVGDGELRYALQKNAVERGLEGRCHFLGWREDLPRVYEGMDLVALTSRNEGTPLSLLEAMSAGRPVASTQVGGVGDILGDKEEGDERIPLGEFRLTSVGAMVRAGDPWGFSRAVRRILNDAELAVSLGRAGRERAKARYSVERLVMDLDRMYRADLGFLSGGLPRGEAGQYSL